MVLAVRAESLEKAHTVSTRIEERVRAEVARIDRVIIHCEPQARTHLRVAVPLADLQGTVSAHFGEAPFFARLVVRTDSAEVEEQQITANPLSQTEKARGILVAEWLIRDKIYLLIWREPLGKGPEYAFRDAGVEVEVWEITRLTEAIDRLRAEIASFV